MHNRKYWEDEYSDYKSSPEFYKAMVEYSLKFQEPVMMGFMPHTTGELKDAVKNNQPIRYKDDENWY